MGLLLIIITALAAGVALYSVRRSRETPDWEISPSELDIGESIGMGGYCFINMSSYWLGVRSQVFTPRSNRHNVDTGKCIEPPGAARRWP
jgi:hypothetical protein